MLSSVPRIVGAVPHVPDPCAHCEARPISVCAALAPADLHRLAALATVIEVEPGSSFIAEGDTAEHFYNVTRGTARLCKLLPDGRRQITGFARAGHFLGLAVRGTFSFGAEAVDQVRVCRFSRTRLRAVLEDFPEMERRLLDSAVNELVAAQEQMLLLGRKTARERVASFLLSLADAAPTCAHRSERLHLPMNRTDIADYLGLTIETVSRTFTGLKKDRLLALPVPTEVTILDRDGLENIAAGWSTAD